MSIDNSFFRDINSKSHDISLRFLRRNKSLIAYDTVKQLSFIHTVYAVISEILSFLIVTAQVIIVVFVSMHLS